MTSTATANVTPALSEMPKIISVDDHILEPRTLWQEELPASACGSGARRSSARRCSSSSSGGHYGFERNAPDGKWCDLWLFDDLVLPTGLLHAAGGRAQARSRRTSRRSTRTSARRPTTRRPASSTWTRTTSRSPINYPNTFPRFAGQGFAERADKELALRCLQIYNDWMIDDWCGGDGKGRLIPLTLVPLWDPAARGRRGAALRGEGQLRHRVLARTRRSSASRRSTAASGTCSGTRARRPTPRCRCTSARRRRCRRPVPDAPLATTMSLSSQNAEGSLCDWVFSGTLVAVPDAEDLVRREPDRLDAATCSSAWTSSPRGRGRRRRASTARRASIVKGRVWGCVFDDQHGLNSRDAVGLEHILFETDYPHTDGTWPESREVAHRLCVDRRHGRRRVLRVPARQRHRGLRPRALRHHRVDDGHVGRSHAGRRRRATARPSRRRAARRDRPPEPAVTQVLESIARPAGLAFADYLVLGVVRRSPGQRSSPTAIAERARPHHGRDVADPRPARGGRTAGAARATSTTAVAS